MFSVIVGSEIRLAFRLGLGCTRLGPLAYKVLQVVPLHNIQFSSSVSSYHTMSAHKKNSSIVAFFKRLHPPNQSSGYRPILDDQTHEEYDGIWPTSDIFPNYGPRRMCASYHLATTDSNI